MDSHIMIRRVICVSALGLGAIAPSWSAPGEDPVVLQKKVTVQMQPWGSETRSGYIQHATTIPAWQQARLSRYVAKAFSGDTTGILTEKDVVHAVNTQGGKVVCSQSVGSNIGSAATTVASGKPNEQVVVLREDLVNICW